MIELDNKSLCKDCLGCSRIEDIKFKGVTVCNNYIIGLSENEKPKNEKDFINPWNKYIK